MALKTRRTMTLSHIKIMIRLIGAVILLAALSACACNSSYDWGAGKKAGTCCRYVGQGASSPETNSRAKISVLRS